MDHSALKKVYKKVKRNGMTQSTNTSGGRNDQLASTGALMPSKYLKEDQNW